MKTVVVLSGGMDSTTLLAQAVDEGGEVHALSVHYGQRHKVELKHAEEVTDHYRVPWQVVDLGGLRPILGGSSQTDSTVPVPHGHYAAENMKATVVPNRNMLLLGVGVAYAISHQLDRVGYAAHAGDHTIYPDCRPSFVEALGNAVALCDWSPPSLWAPYLGLSKAEIASLGATLGVPYGLTYSCYEGEADHCGRCGTCVERIEAFKEARVDDPTRYTAA